MASEIKDKLIVDGVANISSTLIVSGNIEAGAAFQQAMDGTASKALSISSANYGGTVQVRSYEGEGESGELSGATGAITLNIPAGAVIESAQIKVKTAVTSGDGGTDFNVAFSGGATTAIGAAIAFAKNTAANKVFVGVETDATTQITLTCAASGEAGGETFSGGEVVAVVLVREITSDLTDFA